MAPSKRPSRVSRSLPVPSGGTTPCVCLGFGAIRIVGAHAQNLDFGALDGFADFVEGFGDFGDDVVGHGDVEFAGEFDEACGDVEASGFPGEVEGVDGDAVSAEAGAGVEGLEAEGFGFGGVDDFPDVETHFVEDFLFLSPHCGHGGGWTRRGQV